MLEQINQLDRIDPRENIKMLIATNRPDNISSIQHSLNLAAQL